MAQTQSKSKSDTKTKSKSNGKNITLQEKAEGMRGAITLDEDVVATIAGLCAQQIRGIYSLGKQIGRASCRERVFPVV